MKHIIGVGSGNLNPKQAGNARNWWWKISVGILFFLFIIILILAIVPSLSPALGASMADFLREVFGPQPVALLESVSSSMHDALLRHIYTSASPQISWTASTPLKQAQLLKQVQPQTQSRVHGQLAPVIVTKPENSAVVLADPQIGWQPYGPLVNGMPVMARTLVSPDSHRPYAAVALVRMDLSMLQLHTMPGVLEPSHAPQVVSAFPARGMIPVSDQKQLVAAFNGGFKAVNGNFGMMLDGVTVLPARPNMGTVAIYKDGRVQIGVWGKDIVPSTDMVAYRQNCPALIDAGQLNPDLQYNNRNEWGYTGNTDITWRTGLGITQDGKYLIYAVGNGTSAMTLAQVLQKAGAYAAVQLDINQFYAHFVTYQPVNNPSSSTGPQLVAERLLDKMINETRIYLTPVVRDFFYLTAR